MNKKILVLSKLAILVTTLIWGSSFIIMKHTVDNVPTFLLLAIRFSVSFIIMFFICLPRLERVSRKFALYGIIAGIFLFTAYSFQTYGLIDTTPGKNAFLTAVYCVLVPFMFWAVRGGRPKLYNIAAAFICLTGIGLVGLDPALTMGRGDALTLVGGVFYALHMVALAKFGSSRDPIVFSMLQFGTCAILSWCSSFIHEGTPDFSVLNSNNIISLAYLAIFGTCLAFVFQTIGQKYLNPSTASIIMSLESVFGVVFAILLAPADNIPTLSEIAGFVLIFAAILLSENVFGFGTRKAESSAE